LHDIKGDNVVLSLNHDGTVHAAKIIDWGLARMQRSAPREQPPAPPPSASEGQMPDHMPHDAPLDSCPSGDDVPSGFFHDQNPDLDAIPDHLDAKEWLHSKGGHLYVKDQHAPELKFGHEYTPKSDLWAFATMILHEMLYCCCSKLVQADDITFRVYSRRFDVKRKYPMAKSVGEAFRMAYADQTADHLPSEDDKTLFNELCTAYESM
jgi:serine/threonine protein kinase